MPRLAYEKRQYSRSTDALEAGNRGEVYACVLRAATKKHVRDISARAENTTVAIRSTAPLLRLALAANFLLPLLWARALETWRQTDPELARGSAQFAPPHNGRRRVAWR